MTARRGTAALDWPDAFHLAGAVLYMISVSSGDEAPRLVSLLRPYGSGLRGLVSIDGRSFGVMRRVPPGDAAELEAANAAWGEQKERLLSWLRSGQLSSYAPQRVEPLMGAVFNHPNFLLGRWDWWRRDAPKVRRADIDALLSGTELIAPIQASDAVPIAAQARTSKKESDMELIARAYIALVTEGKEWSRNKDRDKCIAQWIIENTGRDNFSVHDRTYIRGVNLAIRR